MRKGSISLFLTSLGYFLFFSIVWFFSLFFDNSDYIPFIILDETIDSSLASPGLVSNEKDAKDNNNNTSSNNEANGRSAALERAYVHDVYENCEEPVGNIRPKVAQFLASLDPGSFVCDVGCGNGRYLTAGCNPSIYSVGVDRCCRLTKIASSSGAEVKHSFQFIFAIYLLI